MVWASYATVSAENTIRQLKRNVRHRDRVDVVFLTSSPGQCFHSAILVSANTLELLPSHDGACCKVNHSMLARSLLNVHGEAMKNGFKADFRPTARRVEICVLLPLGFS
jgi:hypothetical protein